MPTDKRLPRAPLASRSGPKNPRWLGDAVGYAAAHLRIERQIGKASLYPCARCSQQANSWAYNHAEAPAERRRESRRGPFSTHLADYMALCFLCHGRFDHGSPELYRGPRKLTAEAVATIKARLRDGDTHREIAEDYGVHYTLISAIKVGRVWSHIELAEDPDAIPGEPPLAAASRRLRKRE